MLLYAHDRTHGWSSDLDRLFIQATRLRHHHRRLCTRKRRRFSVRSKSIPQRIPGVSVRVTQSGQEEKNSDNWRFAVSFCGKSVKSPALMNELVDRQICALFILSRKTCTLSGSKRAALILYFIPWFLTKQFRTVWDFQRHIFPNVHLLFPSMFFKDTSSINSKTRTFSYKNE